MKSKAWVSSFMLCYERHYLLDENIHQQQGVRGSDAAEIDMSTKDDFEERIVLSLATLGQIVVVTERVALEIHGHHHSLHKTEIKVRRGWLRWILVFNRGTYGRCALEDTAVHLITGHSGLREPRRTLAQLRNKGVQLVR